MEFDYVIVGGGSAGCVLASRLTEDPAVTVALLEAGPPDRSALVHCPAGIALMARVGSVNWNFATVPQPGLGGRRGYQPRGKVLGGSSSVNAMIYARGHRSDYDQWAAEGNPGWSYDEVLPWFKRAEHNERGADAFHGVGGPLNVKDLAQPNRHTADFIAAAQQAGIPFNPDFNGAELEGVGTYQVTHRAGERCSAAKAYLAPALQRRNLSVLTDAHATRVLLEGRRAVGVAYRRGGAAGPEQTVQARREVLMSAGALQSPQLLQLSGIGPAAQLQALGIAVVHDLPGVGAQLHDHLDSVLVVDAPGLKELFGLSLAGVGRIAGGMWDWARHRRGVLTTNFAEGGAFIRSNPDEAAPDLQLHFVIGKLVDHGRKTVFGHGYSCHVCLLRPKSRGSVRLASPDPMAPPLIDPNFLGDERDLAGMVRGFRTMRRVLSQPALARHGGRELAASAGAQTDEAIARFIRERADTIYHPVGTCRMGPRETDVVDAMLQVHGVERLRVVDASVMPQIVSGNTNAPTIMIAERASDLIRQASK